MGGSHVKGKQFGRLTAAAPHIPTPRIRWCAEWVISGHVVGYDADLIAKVRGLVLVTVGGMVSSGTVHPLLLQSMLC
jgi:hypothetical protein